MAKKRSEQKKPLEILNNQLAYAAANGDMGGVNAAIVNGAEEHTAVAIAAESGHTDIVKFMMDRMDMENGDDLEALENALSAAARNGHAETAILLMSSGVDPGRAILPAIENGHGRIAEAALRAGGDFETREDYLHTCLAHGLTSVIDHMVRKNRIDFAECSIDYGSRRFSWGRKPDAGKLPIGSVAYLLDHGYKPERVFSSAVSSKRNDIIDLLMARGEVDAQSLLLSAIKEGSMDAIGSAIARGADISADNGAAILAAIRNNHAEATKFFLDSGCNIDAISGKLLVAACERGMDEIAIRLVRSGADVNSGDGEILDRSLKTRDRTLFDLLLEKGLDAGRRGSASLALAVERGEPDRIPALLASGAKMEEGGTRALETALSYGREKAIAILLENGASLMDGLGYALRNRSLERIMPHVRNAAPDALDPTEALKLATKLSYTIRDYGSQVKEPYIALLRLLMEKGADIGALPAGDIPPELGVDLVSSGIVAPGLLWGTFDPSLAFRRVSYLVSGKRPAVRIPRPGHTPPRDAWREGIRLARESEKDMIAAAERGGMPAFLAMMAANAERLADMAEKHNLSVPEQRKKMRENAAAWRKAAGQNPALCAATETAAAWAEPGILQAALLALPSADARAAASPLLAEHALAFSIITQQHAERLAKETEKLDVILRRSAMEEDSGRISILQQKLANASRAHVAEETLARLGKIAEASGADAAISALMANPQSFDIHFMGPLIGRFRPWVWLRRMFHADAWHASLSDYKARLASWQQDDMEGSFAALREILELRHAAARHVAPFAALRETSGESAAFFTGIAKLADGMASTAIALSPEGGCGQMTTPVSPALFTPLPDEEPEMPQSPRPPMPTMEG